MKMNLSVVLKAIDKSSQVIKKVSGEYGMMTPKINESNSALKKTTQQMSDVRNMNKWQKQLKENTLRLDKLKEAKKKLDSVMRSKKSTAAQAERYSKLSNQINALKSDQTGLIDNLKKTGKELKKDGVNTKDLAKATETLSTSFETQKDKLDGIIKRYHKIERVKKALKKPIKIGMAVGAAGLASITAGAAGLFSTMQSATGDMDELKRTVDNLKMSLDDVQAIRFQAKNFGLNPDQVDDAFYDFQEKLGEMQKFQTGALANWFKDQRSPLIKEMMNAKGTSEAYQILLKQMGRLKTNQERMFLANEAFGDAGKQMLSMLEQGHEGLTDAKKEYLELGGGVSSEQLKAARNYKVALNKIEAAYTGIKNQVLTPIIIELTAAMQDLIGKFKNADWRSEAIKEVTESVKFLFEAVKTIGGGLIFLKDNFAEVVAVVLLLKPAIWALNAAMYANPIGLLVALIAAAVIAVGYLMVRFKGFRDFMLGLGSTILSAMLMIPHAIITALSKIPKSILPDGWGDNIEAAKKKLDDLKSYGSNKLDVAFNGDSGLKAPSGGEVDNQMNSGKINNLTSPIKNPIVQSKSEVSLKIKSDKPVTVEKLQKDSNTEIGVETGDLLGFAF